MACKMPLPVTVLRVTRKEKEMKTAILNIGARGLQRYLLMLISLIAGLISSMMIG